MKIIITLVLLLCCQTMAMAEKPYEDNLRLFIAGDLETLVKDMETEKDWDMSKGKLKLGAKNAVLYTAALIANGEVSKLAPFVDLALDKYPKDPDLRYAQKQLDFFQEKPASTIEGLTEEEKAQLRILDLFPVYFSMKGAGDLEGAKLLEERLLEFINKVSNRFVYFPGQIEYLLEFEDESLYERVRTSAQTIIANQQTKLFPTTEDNYELALAYRALAILAQRAGSAAEAESYFKLSYNEVLKMRSYWVVEDLIINKPIMKTRARHTKLGYVLPQYIYILRERFKPIETAVVEPVASGEGISIPTTSVEVPVSQETIVP